MNGIHFPRPATLVIVTVGVLGFWPGLCLAQSILREVARSPAGLERSSINSRILRRRPGDNEITTSGRKGGPILQPPVAPLLRAVPKKPPIWALPQR